MLKLVALTLLCVLTLVVILLFRLLSELFLSTKKIYWTTSFAFENPKIFSNWNILETIAVLV